MHKPMHGLAAIKNRARHDHAVHQFGPLNVDFLQNDAADAQAHEMRLLNAEVVGQHEDVLGNDVKIIRRELGQDVLAVSMVSKVDEQQTKVRCKSINLEFPRADAAACPMHKDQPRRIGILRDDFVVQQRVAVDVLLGFDFRHEGQISAKISIVLPPGFEILQGLRWVNIGLGVGQAVHLFRAVVTVQ